MWADRFEDVGAKLVDAVRLDVSLTPTTFAAISGDTGRGRCVGRLDATADEITIDTTS